MKTLILVRHAKSTWDYPVDDVDRPLEESGIKAAYKVAKAFKPLAMEVDAIYSSPAARALTTCMIFMRELRLPLRSMECVEELYDFSGDKVFQFIKKIEERHDTVLLFGHNHAFTHLANTLGNEVIENVPTAGLVQINFELSQWSAIGKGITKQTIFPKQLK